MSVFSFTCMRRFWAGIAGNLLMKSTLTFDCVSYSSIYNLLCNLYGFASFLLKGRQRRKIKWFSRENDFVRTSSPQKVACIRNFACNGGRRYVNPQDFTSLRWGIKLYSAYVFGIVGFSLHVLSWKNIEEGRTPHNINADFSAIYFLT